MADRRTEGLPLVVTFVRLLGFLYLLGALAGAILFFVAGIQQPGGIDSTDLLALGGILFMGITFGVLLIALGALLRNTHLLALSHRSPDAVEHSVYYYTDGETASGVQPPVEQRGEAFGAGTVKRLLARITEVRDLMVVGPHASRETRGRLHANLQRIAAQEIIDAINGRRLGKARILLQDAEAAYGNTATLERIHNKIDEAAKRNEPLDYGFTRRVVEEAINAGRWDLAEQCAQAMSFDHPGSARGRRLWDDTRRARLHAHIQARARDHHWAEALAAAEEFLERFPGSFEAGSLREQLGTLRTNAEILQRKHYETKFQSLIAGHHYREALRIARHVVRQYPDSPQAHALRDQIPLLEKRVAR